MNKKIIIGITLAVIIVLAGFSSVASAQTIKSNTFFQQIKDKIENKDWYPGEIILNEIMAGIIVYLALLFMMIFKFPLVF
ncbi:MAG: hypothetical protein V1726_05320 [Methanobacteriota archaeon]